MKPRLLVDGMLGSLARKLRIYGFDVFFDPKLDDDEILLQAEAQRRVIISADEELCKRAIKRGLEAIYVRGRDDVERLGLIFDELGVDASLDLVETRCPLCNGILKRVGREEVSGVPQGVLQRYEEFYVCRSCGHVYWEGSHWDRLKEMDEAIKRLRNNL